MKHLDAILLLTLSFLFTQFKLDVTTVAEYLIPIIIAGNILYVLVTFFVDDKHKELKFKLKVAILLSIFVVAQGKALYAAIQMRHLYPAAYPVHDTVIQVEQAARYLYQGKNPYSQTYKNIGMERYWPGNPAVYHVAYLPFYLLSSAMILYPFEKVTGYFDERFVHLLFLLPLIYLFWKLKNKVSHDAYLLLLIIFFFNPFFIHYLISGRNDIFVFILLALSFYYLLQRKNPIASVFFGLAFTSKQTAWLLLPFYFYYLLIDAKGNSYQRLKYIVKSSWIFFLIVMIFIVPFYLWDKIGFINGIYYYSAGGLSTSYPIGGFGVGSLLRELSWIKSNDYFPFWIFQFVFGAPVFFLCIKFLQKHRSVPNLIRIYAIILFVFWFFSRFFNDNYVGFIIMLLSISYLYENKNYANNQE